MFTQNKIKETTTEQTSELNQKPVKYQNILNSPLNSINEMNYNIVDKVLENEKQHNKTETWNKLDKIMKVQKLHAFAEKYGKDHNLPIKEIKNLKMFFSDCLDKSKLQKTKDVVYDKDSKEITNIPALYFNSINHNFTLKIMDAKRVSTLKSLTPKRNFTETIDVKDENCESCIL
jgi:hypothetical protein